jgi:hypothetical protein
MAGHHAIFGDLRVPSNAVTELVFDPAPPRLSPMVDPKKVAKKEPEAANVLKQ